MTQPNPRLAEVTATPPVRLDPAGRIADDVSCRKCGYNLRGLLPDGICPECSGQVVRSLQGNRLSLCNPIWVRTLATGAGFVALGVTILSLDVTRSTLGFGNRLPTWLGKTLFGGWMLSASIGFWRVTTAEPWNPGEPSFLSARSVARYVPLAMASTVIASYFVSRWKGISLEPFFALFACEGLVLAISGTRHFRLLAQRIPDFAMMRWLGIVKWVSVVLLGLALLGYAAQLVSPASKAYPPTSPATQYIGCALAWGLPAVLLWFVSVFVRLWIAIRDEARLAAAQWQV